MKSIQLDDPAVQSLIAIGRVVGDVQQTSESEPFVIVPEHFKLESLKKLLPPARIEQNVTLLEHGSFCDYVNRFKTADTLIFADVTDNGARFVALLDYHGPSPELKPAYVAHRAVFSCIQTVEWAEWIAANAKKMDQVGFATFLEEHAKLIQNPPGAELLELVQNLEGKNEARFNSGIRLQNGQLKLTYDEDVVLKGTSQTKAGEIELPAMIKAGIVPFQGVAAYEVNARLKYRIENRKLLLWYETVSPHLIVRDAILGITTAIAEKTSIVPLIGRF